MMNNNTSRFYAKLAEAGKLRQQQKQEEERLRRFIIPPAQIIAMVEQFIDQFPSLKWPDIQAYQVPAPYEQEEDWNCLTRTPDAVMLSIFQEAGSCKIAEFPTTDLQDVGAQHNGKAVAVKGKVVSLSELEVDPLTIEYVCQKTGHKNSPGRFGRQPATCSQCDSSSFEIEFTEKTRNLQALRVQQGNHILSVVVRDESLLNSVRTGKNVYAFGVMTFEPYIDHKTKKATFRKYLEAVNLAGAGDEQLVQLTEIDRELIRQEMEKPQFYEKVLASFAPHVYGMEAAKESALLAIASIGSSRPARVLWIGDPGVAKSLIMEYALLLVRDSNMVEMGRTKHTGLTVTSETDEETGRWMVTPGLLSMSRLVEIDELQLIADKDAMSLNGVIESGKIRYALAGGNYGTLDANCALIMACNPYQGRIYENENIQETLKFLGKGAPAFISRMTLIYFFRDRVDEQRDTAIARAVLKNSGENPLKEYEEDWIDAASGTEYFGTKTLRKILEYVSQIPIEAIPEEFDDELIKYYVDNRKDVVAKINKLLTARFLRDAVKLAQFIARLQGQTKPNRTDIDRAINLLSNNMEEAAFDPVTKELDTNLINAGRPSKEIKKEQNEEEQFWSAFESLKAIKGIVSAADWVSELVTVKGWRQEKAEKWIAAAEQQGRIYGVANGDIRRANAF